MCLFEFLLCFVSSKFVNPFTDVAYPVIQNQGWTSELNKSFYRLPARAQSKVREAVWDLSQSPTGLALYFKSNSPNIAILNTLVPPIEYPTIPKTGVSGYDLYAKDTDGKWYSVFDKFSYPGGNNQVGFSYNGIRAGEHEFRLFLHPFSSITDFKMSVNDNKNFEWIEKDYRPPIFIYGTSIVQGACASRPIMVWPTIMQRHMDRPVVNLGFSNNARLEPEVIELMIENEAAAYVLDCLPDLSSFPANSIKTLVKNAVNQIRAKRATTPILIMDHPGYSNMEMNAANLAEVTKVNNANKEAYDELVAAGVSKLYRMTREEIGMDIDCWANYIHPNCFGMERYAENVEKKLHEMNV